MFYGAKNGSIKIDNTEMDYIVFGNGSKPLIMIPGLGEGLKTVKGTAIPFAMMYREVAKEYKVYCFFETHDETSHIWFSQSNGITITNLINPQWNNRASRAHYVSITSTANLSIKAVTRLGYCNLLLKSF